MRVSGVISCWVFSACMLMAAATPQPASGDTLIPLEILFAAPAVTAAQISPDGLHLAVVNHTDAGFQLQLNKMDGTPVRSLSSLQPRGFDQLRWSGDGRFLLYLQDADGDEGYHLFRIDPWSNARSYTATDLTPFAGVQVELIAVPAQRLGSVVISMNKRDPQLADAYRLDLHSGRLELAAKNSGAIISYLADAQARIRAAVSVLVDGRREIFWRANERQNWRSFAVVAANDKISLLSFQSQSRILLRTNIGHDFEQFQIIDLAKNTMRMLRPSACHAFDAGGAMLDPRGKLVGESCVADVARVAVGHLVLQRLLDSALLKGYAVEPESRSADGLRMIIYAHSAKDAGAFWLVDGAANKLSKLYDLRPALHGYALRSTQSMTINARDGLRLPIYLTLPSIASANLPTVLSVHGGPWDRDRGGFSAETQMLANRGYAVLQVNFRGSTGLGRRHAQAAIGEFGARMSDDLLDAIDWVIAHKISDPKRICILGGSYGGYAALVGLTRDPHRFACGVSYAGPVDLVTLLESFPPSWKPYLPSSWYRFVGNPTDAKQRVNMAQRSPINHLQNVRAPLLLFQGANDPRVTQQQTDRIAKAFRDKGLPVTYLLASSEGHSFGGALTASVVNRATEKFLSEHLGGRVQEIVAPEIEKALDEMVAAGNAAR